MFKRFALVSSSGLLKLTLFSLALAAAGWMVFGTPDKIKDAADEAGLYDSIVDSVLETAKKQAQQGNEQLPLDQPELVQAAKNAFPPELLSQNSESIINGFYGWLQGDTPTPQFSVDLTGAKQKFADGVADYAQKRYEAMPLCSAAQMRALNTTEIDPFSVECRSPILSGSTVREQVRSQLLSGGEFLEDTTFTAEDLPKDEQGKTFTDNLSAAPGAFSLFRLLPWLLGLFSLLFAAGVLFLSENKRKGAKTIAITLLGTGIFIMVGSLLMNFFFNRMNNPQEAFQASLASIARSLSNEYTAALMRFYVTYIILGACILIVLKMQNRGPVTAAVKTKK